MQKRLVIILGLFILLASWVWADDDNFAKTGEVVLAAREAILAEMAKNILVEVQKMAADQFMAFQEMEELEGAVAKFRKQKEEADQYLKIYSLLTITKLDLKIQRLIQIYEKPFLWKGFQGKDEMRLILADITGIDVSKIEESFSWISLGAFLVILLFGAALILTGFITTTKEHPAWGFWIFGSALTACFFVFLVLALNGIM